MQSETSLNQAGRPSTHPFRDLRSASRAKHRTRKHLKRYNHFRSLTPADLASHPSQKPHYLPLCRLENCPTHNTADGCCLSAFPADLSTAPVAKFTKHEAYAEAQRSRPVTKHHSRVKNNSLKWAKRRHGKREDGREIRAEDWKGDVWWEEYWWTCYPDDMEAATWTGEWGPPQEALQSCDEYTEIGELFPQWCQRRINEMRAVKEARLREKLQSQTPKAYPSVSHNDEDEGYHSSTSTTSTSTTTSSIPNTTLPTTYFDKQGHCALKRVLGPPRWKFAPKYRAIHGFYWFGQYEWYWHRNLTGCWYVSGYPCEIKPWYRCYCDEFRDCEGWDPEAAQGFRLADCMRDEEWERIIDKDKEEGRKESRNEDEDWDVVSATAALEDWEDIDVDSVLDFDVIAI